MEPVEIRQAAPDDADAIADIHVRAWKHAYRGLMPQDQLDQLDVARRAAWWRGILESPPFEGQRTWLAVRAGAPVGFATAGHTRDEGEDPAQVGELQAIYVAPEAWRSGIGSALMRVVVDHLSAQSFEEATVWVLTGNQMGRAFYEKHRWALDGGAKSEVWDGVAMDEIRYRLRLRSS
ncbi:MAG TPA: GNAT family N-acetyltransferase [Actinomycetota bacterium]